MRLRRLIPFILILWITACQGTAVDLPDGGTVKETAVPTKMGTARETAAVPLRATAHIPMPSEAAPAAALAGSQPTPAQLPAQQDSAPADATTGETAVPTVSGSAIPPAEPLPSHKCPVAFSGGLISELRPILAAIPGPGSEGMLLPSDEQMAAWEFLVRSLDEGDIATACLVLEAFDFPYTLLDFLDLPADGARYLALVEDRPVTFGWGTYVIRTGPAKSEAVVQVPHPIADDRTALQGADIFRRLEARALMIAGAHRCANTAYSPCSGTTVACGALEPYRTSDAAHAAGTAFQAAHQALVPCGGERIAIQLHGNGLASCPDLFISNGTLNPRSTALELYASAARRCTDFSVDLADGADGECAFNGGVTVQATYSNGCALNPPVDTCTGVVDGAPEQEGFIFIEQSMRMRMDYACLVKALEEAVGE